MAKYDWVALKGEYIRGDYESVMEFLRSKNIPYGGTTATAVIGWNEEREKYRLKLEEEKEKKSIESIAETEAQIRARQARIAKTLQFRGLVAINEKDANNQHTLKIENVEQARRLIESGLRQEREALDLNKSQIITGNINVAILQTRYGQMLQNMTYEELRTVFERLTELDPQGEGGDASGNNLPTGAEEGTVVQQ